MSERIYWNCGHFKKHGCAPHRCELGNVSIANCDDWAVTERKRATTDPKPCGMTSGGNRAPQKKRAGS